MPVEARVLGEDLALVGRQRKTRAELLVGRVPRGEEHRERIGAALEEHRDEDRVGRGLRVRDARLEEPERQLAGAVDGEGEPGGAQEEAGAIQSGPGRKRHARLDRGQAVPRGRDRLPHEGGAGELVAGTGGHQQVW